MEEVEEEVDADTEIEVGRCSCNFPLYINIARGPFCTAQSVPTMSEYLRVDCCLALESAVRSAFSAALWSDQQCLEYLSRSVAFTGSNCKC